MFTLSGGSGQRPKSASPHFPIVEAVKLPASSSPSSVVADLSQNVRPQSNLILLNQRTIFAEQDEDRGWFSSTLILFFFSFFFCICSSVCVFHIGTSIWNLL